MLPPLATFLFFREMTHSSQRCLSDSIVIVALIEFCYVLTVAVVFACVLFLVLSPHASKNRWYISTNLDTRKAFTTHTHIHTTKTKISQHVCMYLQPAKRAWLAGPFWVCDSVATWFGCFLRRGLGVRCLVSLLLTQKAAMLLSSYFWGLAATATLLSIFWKLFIVTILKLSKLTITQLLPARATRH